MIQHVTHAIDRSQVEDCVAFYELLGFRVVDPPPGIAGGATWLDSTDPGPPSQVHLMYVDGGRPGGGHFALVCPDYDETIAHLRAAGHNVDPRREHWGSPRSYVRDPAGNLIELMAFSPERAGGAGRQQ
jgi:catechol 2,3-dioxygenase-like lactoylglutathione lyase family enzyme